MLKSPCSSHTQHISTTTISVSYQSITILYQFYIIYRDQVNLALFHHHRQHSLAISINSIHKGSYQQPYKSSYMHYNDLNDYMIRVFLEINKVVYVTILMCQEMKKACSVMISLLSICDVMGLHMYSAIVDLDWDCKKT